MDDDTVDARRERRARRRAGARLRARVAQGRDAHPRGGAPGRAPGSLRGPRAFQGRDSHRVAVRASLRFLRGRGERFQGVRRRFRESRGRHRHRSHRPRLRRGRLPAPCERGRAAPPAGDAPGNSVGRDHPLGRDVDQGRRPQDHPQTQGRGKTLRERDDSARVPVLLALHDGACLLRATVVVRPDDGVQGRDDRREQGDQLDPQGSRREPVRQLAREQRRLGL